MKNLTKTLIAVLILLNICFANNTSYKLNVTNLNYTSDKSLEFDIYLLNVSSNKDELTYSLGQYFLAFNPGIANGGTLTYSIVSSDLPEGFRPRNASVFENQLRLACNSISSDKDNLPLISKNQPGLLIARMKLETSADKFSSEPLNLKWTDAASKFRTKIFSFVNNKNVEITNEENNIVDFGAKGGTIQNNTELPKEFSLAQNYPNPFNPETKINYDLPISGYVSLKVYDLTGREVAILVNQQLEAGSHKVTFNGSNFASGIYFYRIQTGNFSQVKRMMLIK